MKWKKEHKLPNTKNKSTDPSAAGSQTNIMELGQQDAPSDEGSNDEDEQSLHSDGMLASEFKPPYPSLSADLSRPEFS